MNEIKQLFADYTHTVKHLLTDATSITVMIVGLMLSIIMTLMVIKNNKKLQSIPDHITDKTDKHLGLSLLRDLILTSPVVILIITFFIYPGSLAHKELIYVKNQVEEYALTLDSEVIGDIQAVIIVDDYEEDKSGNKMGVKQPNEILANVAYKEYPNSAETLKIMPVIYENRSHDSSYITYKELDKDYTDIIKDRKIIGSSEKFENYKAGTRHHYKLHQPKDNSNTEE